MKINKNEKIAEIVGLSFGDGSLTIRKATNTLRFQLRGNATEDRLHYNKYIIPIFNSLISRPLLKKKVNIVESKEPCRSFGIAVQSNALGKFLSGIGIPIGKKKELFIPEWISSDTSYLICFLRGFFDTDGSVFCQKNYSVKNRLKHTQIRLKMVTISKNLAEKIHSSLADLGIKNCLIVQHNLKQRNRKDSYHVEISGGINADKWFSIVGSNNPKHITKYLVWKKFGFCPPYTSLEQRQRFLSGELNPDLLYAGVTEPGQMC